MYHFFCPANVALHLTTPVEHTVASFHYDHFLTSKAPATAHQIAAINPLGSVVTLATMRTLYTQFRVPFTERWGGFIVDEVLQVGRFVFRIVRGQLEVVFVSTDAGFAFTVNTVAIDTVAYFVDLLETNRNVRYFVSIG